MVRRAAGSAARVPGLQQRTVGAEQHERQADGQRKESQDMPSGVHSRIETPGNSRSDGQPQKADQNKPQVHGRLAFWRKAPNRYVRVEIAEQKRSLKKDQTCGPNRRRASEPRKN